jgi:hypothetical protein
MGKTQRERMPVWYRVAFDYGSQVRLTGTLTLDGEEYQALPLDEAGCPADDASSVLRRVSDGQEFRAELRLTVKPVQAPASLGPFLVLPLHSLRRGVPSSGATRYVHPGGTPVGDSGLTVTADHGGTSITAGKLPGDLAILACGDGAVLAHPGHGDLKVGPGTWLLRQEGTRHALD